MIHLQLFLVSERELIRSCMLVVTKVSCERHSFCFLIAEFVYYFKTIEMVLSHKARECTKNCCGIFGTIIVAFLLH
jgi:hypothetical protein